MEVSRNQKGRSHLQMSPVREVEKKHKRAVANSNERRRMRSINNGFEKLKNNLPQRHVLEKMSKANILLHACQYIGQLQEEYSMLIQKLQDPYCRNCGSSAYPEQSSANFAMDSKYPVTFVPEQFDPPFSVEPVTDDESAEDKPSTPGSDVFNNVGSDDKSSVSSLSFSHLIQAVQVLHEKVGFPPSNAMLSPTSSASSHPSHTPEIQVMDATNIPRNHLNVLLIRESKNKKLPVDLTCSAYTSSEEQQPHEEGFIRHFHSQKRTRIAPPKLMHKPYILSPDD